MSREFEVRREVDLPASPDDVWTAITAAPAAWMFPTGMEIPAGAAPPEGAPVTTWDPPHRLVIRMESPDGTFNALDYAIEAREGGPVLGGREPHLAVDPQGRDRLAGFARPGDELADLADQPARDGEQPARGALVGLARRIRRDGRQGGRRDHVGRGGRLEHALGAVALAALFDQLHEAVMLQGPQVVVRLLAGEPDALGKAAGRRGLGQLGEQAGADRVQRGLGGGGIVDDGDVVHELQEITDN